MISRNSVVYVLPGKMGGVVTNLSNLQRHCDGRRFAQYTVLTQNMLEQDTLFEGRMASEDQVQFTHSLPLENVHSVLRRFSRVMPDGGGVLVSSDWLELAWVSAYGTERCVVQILHGDFDHYYDMALRHEAIVDVFIACSRWIAEKLSGLLPNRAPDIHYIPYGVPIPETVRRSRSGPLRLLYAGRLDQAQKRILDLPLIDEGLRRRRVPVEWTIAGGGPHEQELRERWRDGGTVRWVGVLSGDETVELMSGHDVLVLPSEAEGLPLVLLEAMSVGVLPIVSDLKSGIPEVVVPDETGIRIPVGDTDGFANAIASLNDHRSSLESMSSAARALVSRCYDIHQQAARYQDFFARWRELRRPKQRCSRLPYGSRLDRSWMPNPIVRFIRSRTRPELRTLLKNRVNPIGKG